ncbi:MAG: 3'(2'),5'-bisphosphate nucleotidase CysQ [Gemmataceae bacterium]|nr:3'(2'),5'-bisphosphate nucleotidase CysQ [Gemmataceae bacterium]MCS7271173.1 3'(2'),5'-bisphosphate nucleotidase CysQ [Gemmataceae bacterium]MDW8242404.1 inositol monophosphatase family protein [Thermogemmata sp.]
MPFDKELTVAIQAAEEAAALLRAEYERFVAIPDAPADITTPADRAAQNLILQILHRHYPQDALCAEESVTGFEHVPSRGPRTWVVDPIDGTRGFARKNGQFSVMIGLLVEGVPVVGVVAEPAQRRITFARQGGGCWTYVGDATAVRCQVSRRGWADCVLVQSWARPGQVSRAAALLQPKQVIETYSGGIKLASVARGEADLYVNTYTKFHDWDVCAGQVLVVEAGGQVTDLFGQAIGYQADEFAQRRGLLASNGLCHAEALVRLQPLTSQFA